MFRRTVSYDEFLGDYLVVNLGVASDVGQKQTTGGLTHEGGLVGNSGEAGSHVLGMDVVSETDDGHIVWNAQSHLANGVEGGEGDDVVESQDGIGTVGTLQKGTDGLRGNVEVNLATGNEGAIDGNLGVA